MALWVTVTVPDADSEGAQCERPLSLGMLLHKSVGSTRKRSWREVAVARKSRDGSSTPRMLCLQSTASGSTEILGHTLAETSHNPMHFAAELGAKLATRSRHVGVLLGAGASRACGLPDVSMLEKSVVKALKGDQRSRFEALLGGRNLEEVLSRLRRIAALLDKDKGQDVDGLSGAQPEALDRSICSAVVGQLDLAGATLDPMRRFAAWASRSDYHDPLEIFTVNYDLLVEAALEEIGALWFDGFIGSLQARSRRSCRGDWGGRKSTVGEFRPSLEAAWLAQLGLA